VIERASEIFQEAVPNRRIKKEKEGRFA